MHPLPVNHSNAIEECTAFISAMPQMGGFTYRLRVSYEGTCVPKPSFNDVQNSRVLLPNKTWNTVNVLTSICKNLSQSVDKQLTSKKMRYFCDSSNSITSATPVIWVQSCEALQVPPLYTELLKWPMQLTRIDMCCQLLLAMPAVGYFQSSEWGSTWRDILALQVLDWALGWCKNCPPKKVFQTTIQSKISLGCKNWWFYTSSSWQLVPGIHTR